MPFKKNRVSTRKSHRTSRIYNNKFIKKRMIYILDTWAEERIDRKGKPPKLLRNLNLGRRLEKQHRQREHSIMVFF